MTPVNLLKEGPAPEAVSLELDSYSSLASRPEIPDAHAGADLVTIAPLIPANLG